MAAAMCSMKNGLTFCRLREMRLMFLQSRAKWHKTDRKKKGVPSKKELIKKYKLPKCGFVKDGNRVSVGVGHINMDGKISFDGNLHNKQTMDYGKSVRKKLENMDLGNGVKMADRAEDKTFMDIINMRLEQADRSLLLMLNSSKRNDLIHVLSHVERKTGSIEKGFVLKNKGQKDLLLLEFSNEQKLGQNAEDRVLSTSKIKPTDWVDASLIKKIIEYEPQSFKTHSLNSCASVTSQINWLYKTRLISEASTRLNFFVSMLISKIVKKQYKDVKVLPFGSWSCGLALDGGSDVDVVLLHNSTADILMSVSKLLTKNTLFEKVLYVRSARVPIIKTTQCQANVSCDISCNGMSGVLTAEVFYLMNKEDPSFYPLVLVLKILGREHSLSQSGLCSKFSSFMLTMLVLSYLQQQGILPAMKTVMHKLSYVESSVLKITKSVKQKEKLHLDKVFFSKSLGVLLAGFFQYYSTFQFNSHVIDPYFGKIVKSPHAYNVCVINPFDSKHNICRNVSIGEVQRFQLACAEFAKELNNKASVDGSPWGLEKLLSKDFQLQSDVKLRVDIGTLLNKESDDITEVVFDLDGEEGTLKIDGKEQVDNTAVKNSSNHTYYGSNHRRK